MITHIPNTPLLKRVTAAVFISLLLAGCHGHLKHIDGPGHSEDAPGQQKKH
ncbi:MAG: hypothetical protein U5P41_11685 [Gammaproteobacteria bacterium]|nr:hypothetical protein [Gammaproteobacteria bacterium]